MRRFQTKGLQLVFIISQIFILGYGGSANNLLELKTYYKNLFLRETSKIPYDESFILKEIENSRNNDGSNKLRVELEAIKDLGEKELSNTNVIIFLVVDSPPSCYYKDVNHRNVAFKFISVEGFEHEEFSGVGNPLIKVSGKDSILRRDKINITTIKFAIDEKLKANFSVLIIIENAEKKHKLFARKFKLNKLLEQDITVETIK